MDNAVDALKIAFAVLVFVIAVSISMRVLSQAKTVSDEVFYMADKTNFYEYTSCNCGCDDCFQCKVPCCSKCSCGLYAKMTEGRIVSGETIIPTLYRYYKENFNVIIKNENGEIMWEFDLQKEIKAYADDYKSAPWVGNADIDTKKRVDVEVSGVPMKINDCTWRSNQGNTGILEYVSGKKFKETFKEIKYSGVEFTINENGEIAKVGDDEKNGEVKNPVNETLEIVKGNTKMEITYQLME